MTDTTQAAGLTDERTEALRKAFSLLDRLPINEGYHDETVEVLDSLRDALAAQAVPDQDGEAFRLAARLGLTLRFYGGCAQSSVPGTPCAYEVVEGTDRAAAMREAVSKASDTIAAQRGRQVQAPAPAEAKEEPMLNGLTKAETEATASVLGLTPKPQAAQPALAVWFGSMPESNGRENWTAVLHRKGLEGFAIFEDGYQFERSEYKDRVRYSADCMRHVIGELDKAPDITAYDETLHSGYTAAPALTAEQWANIQSQLTQIHGMAWGEVRSAVFKLANEFDALRSTQGGK